VDPRSLLGMLVGTSPRSAATAPKGPGTLAKASSSSKRRRKGPSSDDSIRILHISDTHVTSTRWDQSHILNKLTTDVRRLREIDGMAPHFIVWTGDIAARGAAAEYSRAEEWLHERLLPAAELSIEHVFLTPGNHDADRSKVKHAGSGLRERLLTS